MNAVLEGVQDAIYIKKCLVTLKKKRKTIIMNLVNEKCYYCDLESVFNQPEKQTGEIISVCSKHFYMNQPT